MILGIKHLILLDDMYRASERISPPKIQQSPSRFMKPDPNIFIHCPPDVEDGTVLVKVG